MSDSTGDTEWQQWLDRSLEKAGVKDSSKLDAMTGGVVTASMRSNWKKGRSGASAVAVIEIANALGADAAEGLRAAGWHTIADRVAPLDGSAPPLRDPIEEMLEKADDVPRAERDEWLASYRTDLAALRGRYTALFRMRRGHTDSQPDRPARNGSEG